jgi:hypothetical protein
MLAGMHDTSREPFVRGAYDLAKRKLEFERLREHYEQEVPDVKTSIKNHKKVITRIRMAIAAIDAAQREAEVEDDQLLTNFDVMKAQQLLKEAEADLIWVKNDMFPALVHPELRENPETATTFKVPSHARPDIPGFGVVKIDHWLIEKLDLLLDECLNKDKQMLRDGRNKIIRAVFSIAFPNAARQLDQIKTARSRSRRRRRGK